MEAVWRINTFIQSDNAAGGAHLPAIAARWAQQHRFAVLHQRGLDIGVEVEAHRERAPAAIGGIGAGERILATNVGAVGRNIDAPLVGEDERLEIAVMASSQAAPS